MALPATMTVMFIAGIFLILGAVLIGRGCCRRAARRTDDTSCVACGHMNATGAKFCGHCGQALEGRSADS